MIRVLALLLLLGSPAWAVELRGAVVQGGLVYGRAAPGARVALDGVALQTSADGRFLFGIGRDGQGVLRLEITTAAGVEQRDLPIKTRAFKIDRVDGLPQKTVVIPPEEQARRAKERALVAQARATSANRLDWTRGFLRPVEGGRISGVYGSQRVLNGVPAFPHYGLDFAAPVGTPVRAPAAGVVKLAVRDFLLEGGLIIIDHGYGLSSALMHLSKVGVREGMRVERGDLVGAVGATGRASGPHLDWRINWRDVRVDPGLALDLAGFDE